MFEVAPQPEYTTCGCYGHCCGELASWALLAAAVAKKHEDTLSQSLTVQTLGFTFSCNSSRERIVVLRNTAMIYSRGEVNLMPSRGRKPVLRYRGSICSRGELLEALRANSQKALVHK